MRARKCDNQGCRRVATAAGYLPGRTTRNAWCEEHWGEETVRILWVAGEKEEVPIVCLGHELEWFSGPDGLSRRGDHGGEMEDWVRAQPWGTTGEVRDCAVCGRCHPEAHTGPQCPSRQELQP